MKKLIKILKLTKIEVIFYISLIIFIATTCLIGYFNTLPRFQYITYFDGIYNRYEHLLFLLTIPFSLSFMGIISSFFKILKEKDLVI